MTGVIAWILHRRRRAVHPLEMPGECAERSDLGVKFRHALVEPPPMELPEDQIPAELQGETRNKSASAGPCELPG